MRQRLKKKQKKRLLQTAKSKPEKDTAIFHTGGQARNLPPYFSSSIGNTMLYGSVKVMLPIEQKNFRRKCGKLSDISGIV